MKKLPRALIIPELSAQEHLWRKIGVPVLQHVQRAIFLGNFTALRDYAKDSPLSRGLSSGLNAKTVDAISTLLKNSRKAEVLAGVNEMLILNSPENPYTNEHTESVLRQLWLSKNPLMRTATVVNESLVTTNGLTYGMWVELGRPSTAEHTAILLNENGAGRIYHGECFNTGDAPSYSAHPIWAEPFIETYPSWVTAPEPCPFRQILTGDVTSIKGSTVRESIASPLAHVDNIFTKRWGSLTVIKNQVYCGLDLGLPLNKVVEKLPDGRTFYVDRSRRKHLGL